ncbi:amidohydrolase family protein [Thermodesulfobacteriota bacterium]
MIVDVHYHLFPWDFPDVAIKNVLWDVLKVAKLRGEEISMEEGVKKARETWADPTGERLLASMEQDGIDFTVICATDTASIAAFTPELAQQQNQTVARLAQKHPDRMVALAGVDPRRKEGPEMLRQCFEEFGARGLKYHPDFGYDPSGPGSYKLLEILAEHNAVLLSHTGPLGPPSRGKFAEPILLADIGVDFPEIKVIAAHMGQINWRPWAVLASRQPSLYGDLAMWDEYAFGHYELFCRELRDLIDIAGHSKVLFGTDNPVSSVGRPTGEWIQIIRDLPANAPEAVTFTEEEVDAILGNNAASLLGIGGA